MSYLTTRTKQSIHDKCRYNIRKLNFDIPLALDVYKKIWDIGKEKIEDTQKERERETQKERERELFASYLSFSKFHYLSYLTLMIFNNFIYIKIFNNFIPNKTCRFHYEKPVWLN